MNSFPLIFVVGPTGVGKSRLAEASAPRVGGAILNCDSLQAYQGLDIGTAKPPVKIRKSIPHFLFDIIPAGSVMTAGDYRRLALPILANELPRHPVFAVGGSGFYIQALQNGMFEVDKIDPQVETALRLKFAEIPVAGLYSELQRLDPETADELNPNDSYRIERALMVVHGHGKKLSDLKKRFQPKPLPYRQIKIGIQASREDLRRRIESRTAAMLEAGLIDEVRGLITAGFSDWPLLQSVGYKQVQMLLRGELSEATLAPEIVLRSMQLAKRQMTWFQRDKEIQWFDVTRSGEAKDWLLRELDTLPNERK